MRLGGGSRYSDREPAFIGRQRHVPEYCPTCNPQPIAQSRILDILKHRGYRPAGENASSMLEAAKQELMLEALVAGRGQQSEASRLLGISPRMVYFNVDKYGLDHICVMLGGRQSKAKR